VNSVSWAPAVAPGQVVSASGNQIGAARRLVTGGSDCQVKIWDFSHESGSWQNAQILPGGHTDWVRDVAWSPTVLSKSYIASASQDKTVIIWTSSDLCKLKQDRGYNCYTNQSLGEWKRTELKVDAVAWRVSWSLSGNALAVSTGDNRVSLWKERLSGGWECVKTIEE
jgi:protein transport protein SEC13